MVTLAEELPFAAVVEDDKLDSICSSCFSDKRKDVSSLSRCMGCQVLHYCDKVCQKQDWFDHKHECSFLKNSSPEIPPATCRLIARVAMKLKRADAQKPAFNGRVYGELMDHSDEIQKHPERFEEFACYVSILREYMGGKFVSDPALLLSIYGKVDTNSFEIVHECVLKGHGLYLGLSAHDHSCVPDAHVVFHGIKACLRSPDKNKEYSKDLTVSYIQLLQSNNDRKQQLQSDYYFTCTCARCSDPTLDFLYNSARSTCCPDSYCLLNPDTKELTCNKCGSISGITVKEVIVANEAVRVFDERNSDGDMSTSDGNYDVQTLVEAYEKFSKILSPLNLNLLMLNERLVRNTFNLNPYNPVARKYAGNLLPAQRQYLKIGDLELSDKLMFVANIFCIENPPTSAVLQLMEEAFAALSVSHGPEHRQTVDMDHVLSGYRIVLHYHLLDSKE